MTIGRALLLLLVGCGPAGVPADGFDRCRPVRGDGVCVARDGWITASTPDREAPRATGFEVEGPEPAGEGFRWRLTLRGAEGELTLTDGPLRVVGDGVGCDGAVEPGERAWCDARAALMAWGRVSPTETFRALQQASAAFREAGWARQAAWASAAANTLAEEAGTDPLPVVGARSTDLEVARTQAFAEGKVMLARGELSAARSAFRRSSALAARGGDTNGQALAEEQLLYLQASLALSPDAAADFEARIAAAPDPYRQAELRNTLGWAMVLSAPQRASDALPVLTAALEGLTPDCGADDRRADVLVNLAVVALRLGRLDEAAARLEAAGALRRNPDTERWWWRASAELAHARGRYDEAEAAWQTVAEQSLAWADAGLSWAALDGLAAVAAARGDRSTAMRRWEAADRAFQRHLPMVPLLAGRGPLLAGRLDAVVAHADALIAAGRSGEAFTKLRAARARMLAGAGLVSRVAESHDTGLEAWEPWSAQVGAVWAERRRLLARRIEAPGDERPSIDARLSALQEEQEALLDSGVGAEAGGVALADPRGLRAGELMLLWVGSMRGGVWGWRGFGARDGRVVAAPWLDESARATDPASLLRPFEGLIDGATSVTLLVPHDLDRTHPHLVDLPGGSLIERAPVVWGTDLGLVSRTAEAGGLVVAQGFVDGLSAAGEEAATVVRAGAASGLEVRRLGPGISADDLLGALGGGVDLLHLVGHGERGGSGWGTALRLGEGERLAVPDVLALPTAPRRAVLSGCATAGAEPLAAAGLGLVHAFVAVGSEAAVGWLQEVPDRRSAEVGAAISALLMDPDVAPAEAFRDVVRAKGTVDTAELRMVMR